MKIHRESFLKYYIFYRVGGQNLKLYDFLLHNQHNQMLLLFLTVFFLTVVYCNSPTVEAGVGAAQMGRFRLRNICFT